jgi:hypothetical protein
MAEEVKVDATPQEAPSVHMLTGAPANAGNVWVADKDYYETLPDGRVIQHAVKGAGYPVGQAAQIRGIAGPGETKEDVKRETTPPVSDSADAPPVPAGAERAPAAKPAKDAK